MTRLSLDVDSPALAHGLGLFETMRVARGRVVQFEEHTQRLIASARALSFPPPDERRLRRAISEAATRVKHLQEAALRCMYISASHDRWSVIATTSAIPNVTLQRRRRAEVITLDRALSRALPHHKMTSFAPSVVGLREAVGRGANEALFVDRTNRILEGTNTNVFAMTNARLITAPIRAGILPGIVRQWVLEHCRLEVVERPPTIDELRAGSFLTSSLTMLAPIRTLDGERCEALPREFSRLQRLFSKVI